MTLSLAALASEYSVAEAQLRELVVTDPLTGLPNYRRLLEVLQTEIAAPNRTERPFAVVFFDMDGLKRINDELGHLIGSRAVCRFAETLRAACRTTDTAARYGGDEFVAVLSDTDQEGAQPGRPPRRRAAGRGSGQAGAVGERRHGRVPARRRHANDTLERGRSRAVFSESREGDSAPPRCRRPARVDQRRSVERNRETHRRWSRPLNRC